MSQTTETIAAPQATRKCAIVGTASSWKLTPWNDTSVDILTLNDGYLLGVRKGWGGLPRITHHFDLHPFHQMAFSPPNSQKVYLDQFPPGAYLRPHGHLEWLKTRPFPVWLNQAPPDWKHARTFPREEIQKKYGSYFTSTPAWMLVWAIEQGYNHIEIYGIHLATEWEYIEQRPCMEFWIRHAMDRGCTIVLPPSCPLLKSKRLYAYEPKAELPLKQLELQVAKLKQEGAHYQKQLQAAKWYEPRIKAELQSRLETVNLELTDLRHAQQRVQAMLAA